MSNRAVLMMADLPDSEIPNKELYLAMLKQNDTVATFDVAETLRNEQGSFLVQRLGQTSLVTAESGHSISSWKPIGVAEPTLNVGENAPYKVTKISDQIMRGEIQGRQESGRVDQGARQPEYAGASRS